MCISLKKLSHFTLMHKHILCLRQSCATSFLQLYFPSKQSPTACVTTKHKVMYAHVDKPTK